jgi:hypothetical protein
VGGLLVPLHSTVNAQTPLITLVQQSGYYALAYLGIDDAMKITAKSKGWVTLAKKRYPCSFVQILPEVDSETQRAQVLFWIENDPKKLLLGAFAQIEIALPSYREAIMVKRSALSLFNGEWVVFIPQEEEHHDKNGSEDPTKEEAHEHQKEAGHSEEKAQDEGEEHGHEEEEHEHRSGVDDQLHGRQEVHPQDRVDGRQGEEDHEQ